MQTIYRFRCLCGLLMLGVALYALVVATPTAQAAINRPVRQAEPPVAAADRIAALKSRPPTLSEHFRQDADNWATPVAAGATHALRLSTLRITLTDSQTVAWSLSDLTANNFYLEVDAFHVIGPLDNGFGLLFRYEDAENFYLFVASHDGYYSLQTVTDGAWGELIEWTPSDQINSEAEAINTLGVLADGSQITILLNGTVMATVEDDRFIGGRIGLMAGSFDEGGVEVAFDDLYLWDLDEPADEALTPAPTPQPTPIPTDPQHAELTARLAQVRAQAPLLSDDFRSDDDSWPTSVDDNVAYSYLRRAYHIRVNTANWLGFAFNQQASDLQLRNFLAEVDVSHVAGPLNAEYGILFHYRDGDNFYLYAISGLGTYSLWQKAGGQWTSLIPWTETDLIETGADATNRLGVVASQGVISLLVNQSILAEYTEETPGVGIVGLVAGAFDEPNVEVAFDNFHLWRFEVEQGDERDEPQSGESVEPTNALSADILAAAVDRLADIRTAAPDFADNFRRNTGLWANPDYADVTYAFTRGIYRITVDAPNITPGSTADVDVADFLLEVDAGQQAGPAGQYGVFFRHVDEQNFYLFAVSPLGSYTLWKMVEGEWTQLIAWTDAAAIVTGAGEFNRLGVLAEDAQITLLVNNTPVAQVEDNSFQRGAIALAAGTFDEGGAIVEFDNLALWEIE